MARIFSDLDLDFGKHPITKDVVRKTQENAIINAVKNLIQTNKNEKPFNPKFGSNINAMLFEPLDELTASILTTEIRSLIANYEPRVRVDDLQVRPDYDKNGFNVILKFSVVNSLKPITVSVFLSRLR